MPRDNDALHETGKNAHKQTVSAGRYVISPDESRCILLQPHIEMKPGWRVATPEDIAKFELAEAMRRPEERAKIDAEEEAARKAADEKGELERADAAEQAERAAAKAAANNVKQIVIAPATVIGEEADGSELVVRGDHVERDGKIVATTEEFFERELAAQAAAQDGVDVDVGSSSEGPATGELVNEGSDEPR